MPIFVQLAIAGLIGNIIHTWYNLIELKKYAKLASSENLKIEFSPKQYFKDEYLQILFGVFLSFAAIFFVDELVHFKPNLSNWIKALFCLFGIFGSVIVNKFMGKSEKIIDKIVDSKTNLLDSLLKEKEEPKA